jgi:hypothetical protein
MSSRLATMVKKDRGDAPIVKIKPGVFALRESDEQVDDDSVDSEPPASEPPQTEEATAVEATADEDDAIPEEEPSIAAQELPGADVFPEEDDDDELILANLDDEAKEGKRSRRRRSRRRRGDGEGSSSSEPRESRSERRTSSRGRRKTQTAPAERPAEAGEPVGRDLSDAIETALRSRSRQAKTLVQLAEQLIESGRLAGSPSTLAPTLSAAIRGDSAKRRSAGKRPRFREGDGDVALLEWELPNDAVNAERDAVRAADRQRHGIRRALIRRLKDLPDGALLELLAAWLNAVGVHTLRAVRADVGDFNLAGTLRRGPEETPLAISIHKGRQSVDKDAVVGLRGGLHHFDHARIGWVITLGKVNDDAVEEGRSEGAAPCAVFDGDALAASMEEVGVGIHRVTLPLAVLDVDLLDSLGGGDTRSSSRETQDEGGDSNGSKRRRSRRRGRRRGSRDEATEDNSQEELAASNEDSHPESASKKAAEPAEEGGADPAEASEDTEKTSSEPAAEPSVEAETA